MRERRQHLRRLRRAKAYPTGIRRRACARPTASCLTVRPRPQCRLNSVAKVPPAPSQAVSARTGTYKRSQAVTVRRVRAAVIPTVRPGRAGEYHRSPPAGPVTASMSTPCRLALPGQPCSRSPTQSHPATVPSARTYSGRALRRARVSEGVRAAGSLPRCARRRERYPRHPGSPQGAAWRGECARAGAPAPPEAHRDGRSLQRPSPSRVTISMATHPTSACGRIEYARTDGQRSPRTQELERQTSRSTLREPRLSRATACHPTSSHFEDPE